MRPLLADESCSTEGKIFSYPTSMETSGRAIDLAQNGISVDDVFETTFISSWLNYIMLPECQLMLRFFCS